MRCDSNGGIADLCSVRFALRERNEERQHSKNKNYQSNHRQWAHVFFLNAFCRYDSPTMVGRAITGSTVASLHSYKTLINNAYGGFARNIRPLPYT